MWLIAGLGNPGSQYTATRHNIGFRVVEALAAEADAGPWRAKFSGEVCRIELSGEEIWLLKPLTYMNLSGQSVQPAAQFYKIPTEQVLVIHDELDVPFSEIRLKKGGGHAGHNGLRSIMASLGSPEFARLRMGIGRPPAGYRGEIADYVLSPFQPVEEALTQDWIKRAVSCVKMIMRGGLGPTMNRINTKPAAAKKQKIKEKQAVTQKGSEVSESGSGEPGLNED
jgi:peptidyl-tRNA hydrolase, PTH1 family